MIKILMGHCRRGDCLFGRYRMRPLKRIQGQENEFAVDSNHFLVGFMKLASDPNHILPFFLASNLLFEGGPGNREGIELAFLQWRERTV